MGYSGVARTTPPGGGVRILAKLSSKEGGGLKNYHMNRNLPCTNFTLYVHIYVHMYVCTGGGGVVVHATPLYLTPLMFPLNAGQS